MATATLQHSGVPAIHAPRQANQPRQIEKGGNFRGDGQRLRRDAAPYGVPPLGGPALANTMNSKTFDPLECAMSPPAKAGTPYFRAAPRWACKWPRLLSRA